MNKNCLIVVDMQNDFITGALGTKEAEAIVPAAANRIREAEAAGWNVIATMDTHGADYLSTQEGRRLPVEHCIKDTWGWQIAPAIEEALKGAPRVEKPTFGSLELPNKITDLCSGAPEKIELIGLCTDICVASNALILKASFPDADISVRENCCAGVTPAAHEAALNTMRSCQIDVL